MLMKFFSMKHNAPLTQRQLKLYRNYRILHGIRIAIAFVLTFLFIRLLNLPDHSWPLITLIVVMGPVSFVGNVLPRALERIAGTLAGASLGIIGLHIELYSVPLMLLWCGCATFLCGYLTMSKRPYAALLIGITLAVVISAPAGNIETALWRAANITLGCLLAMLFTYIFPQRAFVHWRIQLADFLLDFSKSSAAEISHNLLSRPKIGWLHGRVIGNVIKMRSLISPVNKETHIPVTVLEEIQSITRDMVSLQRLQIKAHWSSRGSRFLILNSATLTNIEKVTLLSLQTLAHALHTGEPAKISANTDQLNDIVKELYVLLGTTLNGDKLESSLHSYVWLSIQMMQHLEALSMLISLTLRGIEPVIDR